MPDQGESTRVRYGPGEMVAQGGFADAGFADEHDQRALTLRCLESGLQLPQLGVPPDERLLR